MTREVESHTDTPEQVQAVNGKDSTKSEVKAEATTAKADQKAEIRDESEASNEELEEKESPASEEEGEEEENDDSGEIKEEEPKKSKKGGFQKRIDKLTKARAQAEQEKEFWRSEALKAKPAADSKPVEPNKNSPVGKPKQDDFDTHEAYVDAITDWKIEQRDKIKDADAQAKAAKSEIESKVTTYQKGVKAAQEKLDDYDDVIESVDNVPMPLHLNKLLLDSENGPELAYHLAKDPENFARVCKLDVVSAARELGKIEAKLSRAPESAKEQKTTKAPAPLKPVGGSGSARQKIWKDGDDDFQAFKRAVAAKQL
jgi:hypothetical protein